MSNDTSNLKEIFGDLSTHVAPEADVAVVIGRHDQRLRRRKMRTRRMLVTAPICAAALFAGALAVDLTHSGNSSSPGAIVQRALAAVRVPTNNVIKHWRVVVELPKLTKKQQHVVAAHPSLYRKTSSGGIELEADERWVDKSPRPNGDRMITTHPTPSGAITLSDSSSFFRAGRLYSYEYLPNKNMVMTTSRKMFVGEQEAIANTDPPAQDDFDIDLIGSIVANPGAVYSRALEHKDRLRLGPDTSVNGRPAFRLLLRVEKPDSVKGTLRELLIDRETYKPLGFVLSVDGQEIVFRFDVYETSPNDSVQRRAFSPPHYPGVPTRTVNEVEWIEIGEDDSPGHVTWMDTAIVSRKVGENINWIFGGMYLAQ